MDPTLWSPEPYRDAGLFVASAALLAIVVDFVFRRVATKVTAKTKTELDDAIIAAARVPLALSIVLLGIWMGSESLHPGEHVRFLVRGVLLSAAVLVWTLVVNRVVRFGLEFLSRHSDKMALVNERTLPLFDILAKTIVVGGAIYFMLVAWNINVTGWLASAGVLGIALGFAAQDTLSNLFAGVFILADSPYKLGDFLVLDTGERGRVTDIGMRSTRVLTLDDVEIVVPNAMMAQSKIINESGGPYEKTRIRCSVGVAYGSDVAQVKEILLDVASKTKLVVLDDPKLEPRCHFIAMGDSALMFELKVWMLRPQHRAWVLDELNTRVYNRLNEAKIEIPFPKQDVYVYQG